MVDMDGRSDCRVGGLGEVRAVAVAVSGVRTGVEWSGDIVWRVNGRYGWQK